MGISSPRMWGCSLDMRRVSGSGSLLPRTWGPANNQGCRACLFTSNRLLLGRPEGDVCDVGRPSGREDRPDTFQIRAYVLSGFAGHVAQEGPQKRGVGLGDLEQWPP